MPERKSVERKAIRIRLGTITRVHQLAGILSDIERAYNATYFLSDVDNLISPYRLPWWEWPPGFPLLRFFTDQDLAAYVDADDRLTLSKCEIGSPGLIETTGAAFALAALLNVLRLWIQDAHERRKDREYREDAERRRLWLENALLETGLLKKQVKVLRDEASLEKIIRRWLWVQYRHVINLLEDALARCDSGEIVGIEEIPIEGKAGGNARR